MLRVVVLISGHGSNLQSLIEQQQNLQFKIVGVISNRPDVFGLVRAAKSKIFCQTVDHTKYKDRQSFERHLMEIINSLNSELVVLAGFMRILTAFFVENYIGQLINIHPSLLPKYKGLNTHLQVLQNHDLSHGATVHFVTSMLDEGPSIIQAKLAVTEQDTIATLQTRVQQLEHIIYPIAVGWIAAGRLSYKHRKAWLDQKILPVTGFQYVLPI